MVDIPGNNSTTTSIQIGDEFVGSFENLGDTDWIRIELIAGVTYSFNLGAATSSSGSFFDTILELYDASGSLLARNDDTGLAATLNPAIGDRFTGSSYFQFTPTTSGTYYLSASSFDGAYTGEYLLSAYQEDLPDTADTPAELQLGASTVGQVTPGGDRDAYTMTTVPGQYYTVLYGASISPDTDFTLAFAGLVVTDANGAVIATNLDQGLLFTYQVTFQATSTTTVFTIGPSNTGPDDFGQYIVRVTEGSPLDAMVENIRLQPSHLNVYFVNEADVTASPGGTIYAATDWTAGEIAAAMAAFDMYAQVANLTFSVVDDPALADFFMARAPEEDGVAGRAFPYFSTGTVTIDGVPYAGAEGFAVFDPVQAVWDLGLQPGGSGFLTFLHEIGHLLGLAHPFDGHFSAAVLPGVTNSVFDYGDFSLNQEVFTVMSYAPGFKEKDGPTFFSVPFGQAGSPMAFDVAAVQAMYGANTTTNAGNDAYVLPEINGIGTYYRAIWDTGGIDTISVTPADTAGATIDLRAASLQFDSIGGGAVSFVNNVRGGFTIAAGVVIENATGAAGNDRLIGNEAGNVLLGNDGADRLAGSDGDDELQGGGGNDVLFGDAMPGEPTGIGMGNGHVTKSAGTGNFTLATAIDLTDRFSLAADPDIAHAKLVPHVTVNATGDGHFDVYSLTLAAGTTITLDIDHTTGGLDSYIEIYSLDGPSLFFNAAQDDNLMSAGAGGSSTNLDAFGTFTTRTSGTYYIGVFDISDPNFVIDAGQTYELNISVSATTEAVGSGAGDDLLDGGADADTMTGGGGNDHYIVDNAGDVVIETSGGGDADQVSASVSYSAEGQDIERIVLTGSADIDATGQEFDNIITGNTGANHISGGLGDDRLDGKEGADSLSGGPGQNAFVFSSALGAGNVDEIVDFNSAQDWIELDNAIFTGLSEGWLAASAFKELGHHGATADSSDRILYDWDTGDLFFDADGSGNGFATILFANVGKHSVLGAGDFLIV